MVWDSCSSYTGEQHLGGRRVGGGGIDGLRQGDGSGEQLRNEIVAEGGRPRNGETMAPYSWSDSRFKVVRDRSWRGNCIAWRFGLCVAKRKSRMRLVRRNVGITKKINSQMYSTKQNGYHDIQTIHSQFPHVLISVASTTPARQSTHHLHSQKALPTSTDSPAYFS